MFFIFGMPRSGTTLLAQCLNAHTDLVVPGETDFIIPMAFVLDRVKDPAVGRKLIFQLMTNSDRFRDSLDEYLEPQDIYDAIYSSDYQAAAILTEIYRRVAQSDGRLLAGDKSPNDLNFLRMLVKVGGLASETPIIHIVRDVRDLMVSVNRTGWVTDLDLYFPRFWCNQNLYLNAICRAEARYLLLRYEDFVADPESWLKEVTTLLGVEYQCDMLDPDRRHQRYVDDSEVHGNLYQPITGRSVGNYRDKLDASTLKNYETQAYEALKVFGYPVE